MPQKNNTPKNKKKPGAVSPPPKTRRLAKAIADAGVCSRREAERLIDAGQVTLGGETQTSPAINVTHTDNVTVNGRPLNLTPKTLRIFAYHKPAGIICSNHSEPEDPHGRPTLFSTLPKNTPRLVLVGRLDLNSEGLLLLTNNGDFAGKLMHPRYALARTYKARFRGELTSDIRAEMAKGPEIEGVKYRHVDVTLLEQSGRSGANQWAEVTLHEGKNREIRKVFEHFGLQVNRLIRTAYGGMTLGDLPPKGLRELTPEEVETLQKLVKEA